MALYYYDHGGIQSKPIEFSSITEIVSASSIAYLGYSSMNSVAQASKTCKAFTYFALRGFRYQDLVDECPELCLGCGWFTGRYHYELRCDLQADATCTNGTDGFFCMQCVRAHSSGVCCLRCSVEEFESVDDKHNLVLKAQLISFDLNDAITTSGYWAASVRADLKYPYQVTDIVPPTM